MLFASLSQPVKNSAALGAGCVVGLRKPHHEEGDRVRTSADNGIGKYRRSVFRDDRLVGAAVIGCAVQPAGVLRSLTAGRPGVTPL